jgi:acetolactate synthase-1/2/3 large subunit
MGGDAKSNEQSVAEAIAAALARHGVEVLFSQSLPSAVLLASEDRGITQYTYRTENAGAAMADGYARISGRAAVVTAQNGPAATLLVPGLAEALKSSVPVVALVQDVNRDQTDRNAFQDLDHIALFQACAKWVRRVSEPSRAVDYVDMAFAAATGGRPGPAVLMLPADLLLQRIPAETNRRSDLGAYPLDRILPDPARLDEAAKVLAAAKLPLVVAGGGVHLSGAAAEVAALQEECRIPVMTTVMGKGAVDERHPLSLGVGGNTLGRRAPNQALADRIRSADVVLLVGTRTAQNGTDSWTMFSPDARFIHIDADPGEIGRNYEALRLVGDARLTLAALRGKMGAKARDASPDIATIAAGRERNRSAVAPLLASEAAPIRPERLMADLQKVLTPETIVVADASYSTVWLASYLEALAPGMRFLTPRGIAGLGWGLPLAMGAKTARPDAPVLCIVGDGGFAHVWSELETCVRTGTAVVVTVLNNGVLGYQKDAEDVKFGRHTGACYFHPVDHAAIARACGARGVRIERPADYLPAIRDALASGETTIIDVLTDPEAYPPITLFDRLDALRESKRG